MWCSIMEWQRLYLIKIRKINELKKNFFGLFIYNTHVRVVHVKNVKAKAPQMRMNVLQR